MKLIFALGNIGSDYTKTRHNTGFMALDFYAEKFSLDFRPKTKFLADVAEGIIDSEKVILAKPTTYYNETGRSARKIVDFHKIAPEDILVIHDDLALPFGTLRTREKGSDAGNNGIKSLNAHLGENYARIRTGIANERSDSIDSSDFVLSKFTSDEAKKLQSDILPKIAELTTDFITGNHVDTSHRL